MEQHVRKKQRTLIDIKIDDKIIYRWCNRFKIHESGPGKILNSIEESKKDEFIRKVCNECVKFITLKIKYNDYGDVEKIKMSPSKIVDDAWHLLILESKDYIDILSRIHTVINIFPIKYVHHSLDGSMDSFDEKNIRYKYTIEKYKEYFNNDLPSDIWDNIEPNIIKENKEEIKEYKEEIKEDKFQIFIITLNDKKLTFEVSNNTDILDLKKDLWKRIWIYDDDYNNEEDQEDRFTKDIKHIRLLFAEMNLQEGKIMSDYNIDEYSIIYMVETQIGC